MLPTTLWWGDILTSRKVPRFQFRKGRERQMHKSDFLCVGQGHNGLFTRGTDVTLFSAIRTHKGHLGHAKQEHTNFHIVET